MENGLALNRRSSGLALCSKNILDMPVIVWDNIMPCNNRCMVSDSCSSLNKSDKCVKMAEYFSHVLDSALSVYGSYMNEKIMVQIGLHLMPMYSQLFKLKLLESTVTVNRMIKVNKQGVRTMHPIYKEIRETVKSIDELWLKIGGKSGLGEGNVFGDRGDSSYIDALSEIVEE